MSKKYPLDQRNLPSVCTFYIRGECNRGKECPYRHDTIKDADLMEKDIKGRYTGINDPIAKKILGSVLDTELPKPPENKNIMTLFVGGVVDTISEQDLKNAVCSYGEVKKVKMLYKQSCSFLTFTTREGAELSMTALHDRFYINDVRLKLLWAKYSAD